MSALIPEPRSGDRLALSFASFGGCGFAPIASGTVGSAAAALLYWFTPLSTSVGVLLASTILAFIGGVPAASRVEILRGKDPSVVVVDEVVGMWLALLWLPRSLETTLAAFLAFRLFDIVKPWPARRFDAGTGGFNIMMDDVVAGIMANLCVQTAHLIWRGLI